MSQTTPKACVSPNLYQNLLERPLGVKVSESVVRKMLAQTTLTRRRSGLGLRPDWLQVVVDDGGVRPSAHHAMRS
eukprot:3532230-Pleurochrysis_carterae.AAC.1